MAKRYANISKENSFRCHLPAIQAHSGRYSSATLVPRDKDKKKSKIIHLGMHERTERSNLC